MDKETISIIKNQTQEKDELHIERVYYQCGSDIVKTIMNLSNIKDNAPIKESTSSIFDDIRKIVDEKENIYHHRSKAI